ncbi:NADP(H)-dependent aldo-keto reductase [Hahella sp. CCB-MM4]|uniref:NADP(H)-dependent aldo-keto reductase n=1 Tax=Hahella sp. (strain CCB-MM4) TaxID=1926491 RepID=UPI000B9BE4BE|nr:NADP(H)-dependent aldo-keto reductase [Hahella sp. CCB-MM4]OZG70664.1 NADP(H)-dependent aldo-keto reductase [Hahella sp. CCB-MM4]
MQYRKLGRTDVDVSAICLGTMTWGEQNTEAEAHEQLDYALDQGINFIDTAEMYPVPPRAETQGRTEQYIGTWLASRGNREKVVLASKVAGYSDAMSHIRGGPRLNRQHIEKALDDSLSRLQTDYLDLYQLHWPDRPTNFFGQLSYQHQERQDATPILETLEVLEDLVKAGKVRHVGLSNETPWGTMKFLHHAEQSNLPRVVSIQNPYSLLNRSFEVGLAEVAHREQVGLLAYSPMAFGVLSGKYIGGERPANARITLYARFSRYTNAQGEAATEVYQSIADKYNLSLAQMALAYVTSRSFVTSNIIGATSMAQLKENIDSINLELSPEMLEDIESVHQVYTYPCP